MEGMVYCMFKVWYIVLLSNSIKSLAFWKLCQLLVWECDRVLQFCSTWSISLVQLGNHNVDQIIKGIRSMGLVCIMCLLHVSWKWSNLIILHYFKCRFINTFKLYVSHKSFLTQITIVVCIASVHTLMQT